MTVFNKIFRGASSYSLFRDIFKTGRESSLYDELLDTGNGDIGIYVYNPTASAKDWIRLLRNVDGNKYFATDLMYATTITGDDIHAMRGMDIVVPSLSLDVDDVAVTSSGTWSSSAQAACFTGNYVRSNTTNDYKEWTTAADVTAVGLRYVEITNAGFVLISIDGDNTRANNLLTAQDYVDNGELAATALVGGGGTLNPTDRLINQYGAAAVWDKQVVLADDLTIGAHTIRMTITGYKQAASTDDRGYITGFMYAGSSVSMADTTNATFALPIKTELFDNGNNSATEYAISAKPAGAGTNPFLGCHVHGYERQVGDLVVNVDGSNIAIPSTNEGATGSAITVTRTTQLLHPDIGAGGTTVASVSTVYTINKGSVSIAATITWVFNTAFEQSYVHMFPIGEMFDKGNNIDLDTVDVSLTNDDNSFNANSKSDMLYAYSSTGKEAVYLRVPDLLSSVNNYLQATASPQFAIEDRAGGAFNKFYCTRYTTGASGSASASEVWRLHGEYGCALLSPSASSSIGNT